MSTPLQIIRGVDITPAMLTSTTVPEADYPAWSSGTTYPIGDLSTGVGVVIRSNAIYVSLAASNINFDPLTRPDKWGRVMPTNRWRLFDKDTGTPTAQATSMSYTLALPGGVDSVWFGGLKGHSSITVTQTHPTLGTLFSETRGFSGLPISSSWYEWTFGARDFKRTAATFTGLKPFPGTTVVFTINGAADLSVYKVVLGGLTAWGIPVFQGAQTGIKDYSRQVENDYGDLTLRKGSFSKKFTMQAWVTAGEADAFFDYLTTLRSTPAVFIGHPTMARLQGFGIYENWRQVLQHPTYDEYDLTIRTMSQKD